MLFRSASSNGIFGGGVKDSDEDQRWQKWLDKLGRSFHTTNSNHEKVRKAIFEGLDASKYDAIYFQVVPRPKGASVKVFQYPDDDDRVMGILVETPTIKNVLAQIKATGKKRRAAKAKSKKKT